jgi:predicted ATPase
MKLTGARLVNIACFEDLELDLRSEATGAPAPWVVLLGENGTGKSTILQMIGATLLGPDLLPAVAGSIDWAAYRSNAYAMQDSNRVSVRIRRDAGDYEGYWENAEVYSVLMVLADNSNESARNVGGYGEPYVNSTPGTFAYSPHDSYGRAFLPAYHEEGIEDGWFSCGYGPLRRLQKATPSGVEYLPTLGEGVKPFRFASLFGKDIIMTPVGDWLCGLYFRTLHPDHTEISIERFNKAKQALFGRVLPGVRFMEITPDREVIVEDAGTRVSLARLSDGYRSTLAWVGDLVRRLFDAYPDSDDPLSESGVVLVDEIDLHLHPKWQRSIVEDIRRTFPNLQFIVTSHSPFVAQDMRPEDKIIVLERTGKDGRGPVAARAASGPLDDWSADQIYAHFFGLRRGTRGEGAQRDATEYERLLDKEEAGTLTPPEGEKLNGLRDRIERVRLADTPAEEELFDAADAVLEAFRRRRKSDDGNGAGAAG